MHAFRSRFALVALVAAVLSTLGAGSVPVASGATSTSELSTSVVSLAGGTAALDAATTQGSSVSSDGRYVVFATTATNAMTGFTKDAGNTGADVFVRDTVAGTTTLVSAKYGSATAGGNLLSGDSANVPVISADGKFVAFASAATNLVKDQVPSVYVNVFVRDLKAGTTALVSAVEGSSTTGGNLFSRVPSLSADGSVISFSSQATNLVTGYTAGAGSDNVFVRNRITGTTTLASANIDDPKKGGDGLSVSTPASMSANGRVVTFASGSTDLIKSFTDNNVGEFDAFRRDLVSGTTTLVSGKGGSPAAGGNGASINPVPSIDGRLVAFSSQATDLLTGFVDNNTAGGSDVFVRDTDSGVNTLVSHKSASAVAGANQTSGEPSISGDGRYVAFTSFKNSDLGATGTPSDFNDVYVRDMNLDTIVRANVSTAGAVANGQTYAPALALDGHSVVYASGSNNLVTPASGTPPQVYKTELRTPGYWLDASDGGIFAFSKGATAPFFGSTGSLTLNKPMVGMAPYPDGNGYWLVASDGGIFSFPASGHTNLFFGSTGALTLNKPIVGMAAFPNGLGYWLVASDGGIFTFGDSDYYKTRALPFFGSTGAITLNKPIVGMAATPTGQGYWLVASDGGIFNYGDAKFFGSTGAITLNKPIVGMASTPTGKGYWLVASDGGIFAYGDAAFYGSTGAITLNKPVVGMASTPTGMGYWLVASDGGIFAYGDAAFYGSTGALTLNKPIVGMAAR